MSEFLSEVIALSTNPELAARWHQILLGQFDGTGPPLNATSTVVGNQLQVKSGAGMILGFTASSTLASAQFIQLFDSVTLPADGAVPTATFSIATVNHLAVSWIFPGRFFNQGLWICNSTTQNSKTIGAANCLFDVQYI